MLFQFPPETACAAMPQATMHNIKELKFDMTDILIIAFPLLAALCLTLFTTLQTRDVLPDSSFNNARFIVMPRNCYLKTP
ncbi:hypothetical protein GM415_01905 [Pseudodesulfovibrio cashew]|uniref:Uncharacterized protein n=1 Tax=Pseudodesulfovibrio cashew TaxID=2678688 RepID=A0A6I6JA60_9BACT|nr:hypothetical protein [Pseudodesulfovibrio cashew]QGY38941.1 hypothetical protein GM415_01905 [Pseudodesulfovibrio cashew]